MLRSTKLITHSNLKTPIVEAYKTLRTNIQFSSLDKPLQTILITSSGPSEGKSTISSNLAITMAQSEFRVLLVDCDLRKPSLHRAFNLVNARGLTNILAEHLDYKTFANEVGVPNLDVITSGPKPPNPSELLGSQRMQDFLAEVKKDYDIIILDTPPVVPVTDAAVLSRIADGVLLVTAYGRTTYEMAAKAKDNLQKVNANILGVVINSVPTQGNTYYYYYYYEESPDGKTRRKKVRRSTSYYADIHSTDRRQQG